MPKDRFKPDPDDFIIVVMGPTGCGKTKFINSLTGSVESRAASNLKSDTQGITAHPVPYQDIRLVLVDTPGFNDTYRPDTEILRIIADWLILKYPNGTSLKIAGLMYLHRITDNRMSGSACNNLRTFSRLCGTVPLPRTRLVTTMWDLAKESVATQRETELVAEFWRELLDGGATTHRFYNTPDSAQTIVDDLLQMGNNGVELLLQEELIEQQKCLNKTGAGAALYNRFQTLLADQKRMLNELAEEAELQDDPALAKSLQDECERIDAQLQKTFEEMKELNVPLSRRIHLWLSRRQTRPLETPTTLVHPAHSGPSADENPRLGTTIKDRFKPHPDDLIILVMGPVGSGKTNFINSLTENTEWCATDAPKSNTQNVIPYRISYQDLRLVLVDIPGFDDISRQGTEILRIIADWLVQKYADGTTLKITGVIYIHRITDSRISDSALQNLQLFGRLCGNIPLPRTRLVTTMWDLAKESIATQSEAQLISNFWGELIGGGATAHRFHNTPDSAWTIVTDLLRVGNDSDELLLQEELVQQRKYLNETEAGKLIYNRLQKLLTDQRRTLKQLAEEAKLQSDPALVKSLQGERDRIDAQLQKTFEEMKAMKVPLSRRVILWLFGRKTRAKAVKLNYPPA